MLKINAITALVRAQVGFLTLKCCSDDPPPAPNLNVEQQLLKDIAEKSLAIGEENRQIALDKFKSSEEVVNAVLNVQLPMVENLFGRFQAGQARFEDVFQPIEDQLVQDALTFNTAEKRELEAGRAQARVARASEQQRKNIEQRLSGLGVDPSQIRAQALDTQHATATAANQAAAGNVARQQVEETGRNLRTQAIALGRNTLTDSERAANAAANIGGAAVGNRNATTGAQLAGINAVSPFFGTSANSAAASGNLALGAHQGQLNAFNSESGGFGDFLGTAVGIGLGFLNEGGEIDGPGGPTDDAILARLSDGEFVIPANVVKRKGTEFFQRLIDKAAKEDAEQAPPQMTPETPAQALPPQAVGAPGGGSQELADPRLVPQIMQRFQAGGIPIFMPDAIQPSGGGFASNALEGFTAVRAAKSDSRDKILDEIIAEREKEKEKEKKGETEPESEEVTDARDFGAGGLLSRIFGKGPETNFLNKGGIPNFRNGGHVDINKLRRAV